MSGMSKYKRWSEYSLRWRKARSREGLNATRWNRWRRLSPKTQAKTDIRKYAAGESVNAQTRSQVLGQLTVKMHNIATSHTAPRFKPASMSTIRHRLDTQTTNWLKRYNNIRNLYVAVVTKNLQIISEHGMSPLFYHGGAND